MPKPAIGGEHAVGGDPDPDGQRAEREEGGRRSGAGLVTQHAQRDQDGDDRGRPDGCRHDAAGQRAAEPDLVEAGVEEQRQRRVSGVVRGPVVVGAQQDVVGVVAQHPADTQLAGAWHVDEVLVVVGQWCDHALLPAAPDRQAESPQHADHPGEAHQPWPGQCRGQARPVRHGRDRDRDRQHQPAVQLGVVVRTQRREPLVDVAVPHPQRLGGERECDQPGDQHDGDPLGHREMSAWPLEGRGREHGVEPRCRNSWRDRPVIVTRRPRTTGAGA